MLNFSESFLSKEVISEVKVLHNRFLNGELTKKGFKLKKIALIKSRNHFQKDQMKRPDKAKLLPFTYLNPNRSLQPPLNRKLLSLGLYTDESNVIRQDQDQDQASNVKNSYSALNRTIKQSPSGLDSYGESLLYVNQIYNTEYGYKSRRVPAHMPHFINKEIVEELQQKLV